VNSVRQDLEESRQQTLTLERKYNISDPHQIKHRKCRPDTVSAVTEVLRIKYLLEYMLDRRPNSSTACLSVPTTIIVLPRTVKETSGGSSERPV
jgi:hypothetical protein